MDEQTQLATLTIGDSFQFSAKNATFTIRRSKADLYVLGASNAPTRSRSGSASKISADIDFCKKKGRLPKPTSPRW